MVEPSTGSYVVVKELATLDRLMSYLELARDAGFTSGDVERLARREIPEALVIVGRVARPTSFDRRFWRP